MIRDRYSMIDDQIAYPLLVERIGDFDLFCKDIEQFLARHRK